MIFIPNRKSDILSILNFEIILYDKFSDGIEKLAEFFNPILKHIIKNYFKIQD